MNKALFVRLNPKVMVKLSLSLKITLQFGRGYPRERVRFIEERERKPLRDGDAAYGFFLKIGDLVCVSAQGRNNFPRK